MNKFFMLFSWIGNRVLSLFDSNHYQIIDEERYRAEYQFYEKKKKEKVDIPENIQQTTQNLDDLNIENHQINNVDSDWKTLDNNQENVISNWNIWIDLSGHEINNPEN